MNDMNDPSLRFLALLSACCLFVVAAAFLLGAAA